jgi:hypothetical protein
VGSRLKPLYMWYIGNLFLITLMKWFIEYRVQPVQSNTLVVVKEFGCLQSDAVERWKSLWCALVWGIVVSRLLLYRWLFCKGCSVYKWISLDYIKGLFLRNFATVIVDTQNVETVLHIMFKCLIPVNCLGKTI